MRTKEQKAAYAREYRAKHREHLIQYHREWYARMGKEINRRLRKRRETDPDWREHECQRHREYVARKRAEDPRWGRPVKDTPGRPMKRKKI
jgi:hypothetical protein